MIVLQESYMCPLCVARPVQPVRIPPNMPCPSHVILFRAVRCMGITSIRVFPGGWGIIAAAAAPRFKFGSERSDVA